MFAFKRLINKKRGYIFLHTFFIGTLMLIMAVCIFSMQINEYTYNESFKNEIEQNDEYLMYKEILLSKLDNYVNKNINGITYDKIKNHFINYKNQEIKRYKQGKIVYNSENYFELITPYNYGNKRRDIYDYKVEEEKFILIFRNAEYF